MRMVVRAVGGFGNDGEDDEDDDDDDHDDNDDDEEDDEDGSACRGRDRRHPAGNFSSLSPLPFTLILIAIVKLLMRMVPVLVTMAAIMMMETSPHFPCCPSP